MWKPKVEQELRSILTGSTIVEANTCGWNTTDRDHKPEASILAVSRALTGCLDMFRLPANLSALIGILCGPAELQGNGNRNVIITFYLFIHVYIRS